MVWLCSAGTGVFLLKDYFLGKDKASAEVENKPSETTKTVKTPEVPEKPAETAKPAPVPEKPPTSPAPEPVPVTEPKPAPAKEAPTEKQNDAKKSANEGTKANALEEIRRKKEALKKELGM